MNRINVKSQPAVWGSVLIVLGALLLLHRFGALPFGWWGLVWGGIAIASIIVIVRRVNERKEGTFWWVLLFGFALYKFVRVTGWMDIPVWYGFPLMLVVTGVAFALMVVARPKSWHLAVPAVFLVGAGGAMVLAEMGNLDYETVRGVISTYRPVAIITYGGALLLSR